MAQPELIPGARGDRQNAFPIALPIGASLTYRAWTIQPVPRTPDQRERIRGYLWRSLLKRPVSLMLRDGEHAYAVVEGGPCEPVTYTGEGERLYRIAPTDDVHSIPLDRPRSTHETSLAAALLQEAFALHLRRDSRLFRGHGNDRFFLLEADRPYTSPDTRGRRAAPLYDPRTAEAEIYRGCVFRVVYFEESTRFCLVLDVATSYVGRHSLAWYLAHGRPFPGGGDGPTQGHWVYDYGSVKSGVYLLHVDRETIGEVVLKTGEILYDVLLAKGDYVRKRIARSDTSATMVYKLADVDHETKHYSAATTLLRPTFTTDSPEVRGLGDTPAFPPHERWRRIEAFLPRFDGAGMGSGRLHLGPPVRTPVQQLPLPDLAFGSEAGRLQLAGERYASAEARRQWGPSKMRWLRERGPYRNAPIKSPIFVYPASMERDGSAEQFLRQTAACLAAFGQADFDPELATYRDDAHPRDVLRKLEAIEGTGTAGFMLLALPRDARGADKIYAGLKTRTRLPSKCLSARKLAAQMRDPGKLASYIERNALGMLVENDVRPWGLASPLHHELQIGFDLARMTHGSLMAAAVIAGADGTALTVAHDEMQRGDRFPPHIIRKLVFRRLEQFLNDHGRPPERLLAQRKGRWLSTELEAIREGVQRFARSFPLFPPVPWTAVAIEKTTSVPLRLFLEERVRLERALSGCYAIQDVRTGYLVTAGAPTLRQGTPRPLRVEVVASTDPNPQLRLILRDLFWLSQLNWSAPEVDMRLPVTLRFTAQKLERYALELEEEDDEDADEWELDEEEEDEENLQRRNSATSPSDHAA